MTDFDRINRIITRNPAKFSGRSKINHVWLQKTFDWLVPGLATADRYNTRDVLKFVTAYTTINRVLEQRGIHLKARNYYSHYQVVNTKPSVYKRANEYTAVGTAKRTKATTLRQSYNKHQGAWTPLTQNELNDLRR